MSGRVNARLRAGATSLVERSYRLGESHHLPLDETLSGRVHAHRAASHLRGPRLYDTVSLPSW